MSFDCLNPGLTLIGFLAMGLLLNSIGRHEALERPERPLLLAFSYRNALTLVRACEADESEKRDTSRSAGEDDSHPMRTEPEDLE
jgi:hypothetical protein